MGALVGLGVDADLWMQVRGLPRGPGWEDSPGTHLTRDQTLCWSFKAGQRANPAISGVEIDPKRK